MPQLTPTETTGTPPLAEISEPANADMDVADLASPPFFSPPTSSSREKLLSIAAVGEDGDMGTSSVPQVGPSPLPPENRQQQPANGPPLSPEELKPLEEPPSPLDNGPSPSSQTLKNGTDTVIPVDDVVERTFTVQDGKHQPEHKALDSAATVVVDEGTSKVSGSAGNPMSTEDASSESSSKAIIEDIATADAESNTQDKNGGASSISYAGNVCFAVGKESPSANVAIAVIDDSGASSALADEEGLHPDSDAGFVGGLATTSAVAAAAAGDYSATSAAADRGGLASSFTTAVVDGGGTTSNDADRKGFATASKTGASNETPTAAGDPLTDEITEEPTEPLKECRGSNGVTIETALPESIAHGLPEPSSELGEGKVHTSAVDQVTPTPTDSLFSTGGVENRTKSIKSEPAQANLPLIGQAGDHLSSTSIQLPGVIGPESGGGGGVGEDCNNGDPQRPIPQPEKGQVGRSSEQGAGTEVGGPAAVTSGEQGCYEGGSGGNAVRLVVAPTTALVTVDGCLKEGDAQVDAAEEGVVDRHAQNDSESPRLDSGPESEDCTKARAEGEVAEEGPEESTNEGEPPVPETLPTPANKPLAAEETEGNLKEKDTAPATTTTAAIPEERVVAEESGECLEEARLAPTTPAAKAEEPTVAEETSQKQGTIDDSASPESSQRDKEELLLVESDDTSKLNGSGESEPGGPTNISAAGAEYVPHAAVILAGAAASGEVVGQNISGGRDTVTSKVEISEEEPKADVTDVAATVVEGSPIIPVAGARTAVGQNIAGGSDTVHAKVDVNEEGPEVDTTEVAATVAKDSPRVPDSIQPSGSVPGDASLGPPNATKNAEADGSQSIFSDSVADSPSAGLEKSGVADRSGSLSVDSGLDSPPVAAAAAAAADVRRGAATNEPVALEKPLGTDVDDPLEGPDHSLSPERDVASTTTGTVGAGFVSEPKDIAAVEEERKTKSCEAEAGTGVTSVETSFEPERVGGLETTTANGAAAGEAPAKVNAAAIVAGAEPERHGEWGADNLLFEGFEELSSSSGEGDKGVNSSLEGGAMSSSIEGVDIPSLTSGEEAVCAVPGKSSAGAGLVGELLTIPSADNSGG